MFSWAKTFGKALTPILTAAAVTAVLAVLDQVLTMDFLLKYGVPQIVAVSFVAGFNNWRKNYGK